MAQGPGFRFANRDDRDRVRDSLALRVRSGVQGLAIQLSEQLKAVKEAVASQHSNQNGPS